MNKIPLFLDFDEVLSDSIIGFCQVYSEKYNTNTDYTQLKQYNFKDICPLLKEGEVQDIFNSDRFWEILQLKDGCFDVLNKKENIERFEYILVSIGCPKNLYKKAKYVIKHLPMIKQMILLTNEDNQMNKQWVNMSGGGIFIDDHIDNLLSSNAKHKICFKEKSYPWNKEWKGAIVSDWKNIESYLNDIWEIEKGEVYNV